MPDRVREALRFLLRRNVVRNVFLVFFVAMMVQLWMFAQWASGASTVAVPRPEAVAGFIPVGALMSLFAWLKTGQWDTVLPAGIVIILSATLLSLVLKRGFCGWICPVGALFQIPADFGKRLRKGKDLKVWRWLDLTLRGLRYAFAAALVMAAIAIPLSISIPFRQYEFYWIADLKIVSLFVHPPLWWAVLAVAFLGLSVAYGNVWCRWICPLGGIYGFVGLGSPTNVVRDEDACTRCGKCAKACPNRVPVNKLVVVRAPECDGCQTCVRTCPEPGALGPRFLTRWAMPWWSWPVLAVGVWLGLYAIAVLTGHWHTGLTLEQFQQALRSMPL